MSTRLALLTVVLFTTLFAAPQSAGSGLALGDCVSGTLRIEHAYLEKVGQRVKQTFGDSLGTALGPRVVLTHNHFSHPPEPGRGETMTFVECAGKTTRLSVDRLTFVAVDAGTTLIYLPDDVQLAGAAVADRKTMDSVARSAQLTLSYWDDNAGRFARKEFEVLKVKNGVATLADPDRVINSGDSGGGAFLGLALVANTWAIYTNLQGQPTGKVDVALLPAEARRLLAEGSAAVSAR